MYSPSSLYMRVSGDEPSSKHLGYCTPPPPEHNCSPHKVHTNRSAVADPKCNTGVSSQQCLAQPDNIHG